MLWLRRASFGSWLLGSFWGGLPVRRGGCLENSEKRMGQSMLRCAELGFALLRISPGAVCIKRLRLYAWGIYSTIQRNYCVLGANVFISKITCRLRWGQRRNGWRPALALVYVPQAYSLRRLMQTASGDVRSNANPSSAHLSINNCKILNLTKNL